MASPALSVLGLSGSLRRGSHNTKLIRAAAQLLPSPAELVIFEGLQRVPPFSEDAEEDPPEIVAQLKASIRRAAAVLIATPEYNASLPGQLKNALDWVSRPYADNPLRNKPVAVIGASTGMFGAAWAQADTRRILGAIGARVLDPGLGIAEAENAFSSEGTLRDAELCNQLRLILATLVDASTEYQGSARARPTVRSNRSPVAASCD